VHMQYIVLNMYRDGMIGHPLPSFSVTKFDWTSVDHLRLLQSFWGFIYFNETYCCSLLYQTMIAWVLSFLVHMCQTSVLVLVQLSDEMVPLLFTLIPFCLLIYWIPEQAEPLLQPMNLLQVVNKLIQFRLHSELQFPPSGPGANILDLFPQVLSLLPPSMALSVTRPNL
jgi:hypothetical protein